jgi:hypothetical protein
MRESIASAIAVVAMAALNNVTSVRAGPLPLNAVTTRAAEPLDTIGVRGYRAGDFIAGTALGFVGAFDLTNLYYPNFGCHRTSPHSYYRRYHYPDRFYHFGDYRS